MGRSLVLHLVPLTRGWVVLSHSALVMISHSSLVVLSHSTLFVVSRPAAACAFTAECHFKVKQFILEFPALTMYDCLSRGAILFFLLLQAPYLTLFHVKDQGSVAFFSLFIY